MPARPERHRRRRDGRPGILLRRSALPPSQGRAEDALRPACASWMANLALPMRRQWEIRAPAPPRRHRNKARGSLGDAAAALDVGHLDHDHAGAGIGQHAEMGHMPIVADAVIGAVLAHRRDDDAVGELEAGEADGRKQGTRHGHHLLADHILRGETDGLARLNGLQAAHFTRRSSLWITHHGWV